ncbi:2-dehydro-3-deoxygalactonokinase [Chitinophaga agrisoli]|uniref:2-dehydro-3-deoxygalactonokinase n=1 Tax=Chitinophaga agrisoli TaxID=2607653 RepID=A0A5B2VKU2_9BACT|nr:2-dehydro-3-deoxygalactonokinase [Chitinophaga agrisoli]KAA2239318.1 2-dehydro-3-deoxygalactonokinase [Chitinophaga agrisoli]
MGLFLSCDWGTSSFRLRLIQTPELITLAAEHSTQGIAATFQAWEAGGPPERAGRAAFYLQVISEAITALAQRSGQSLQQVPLIISGMASASIGMMELPYGKLPFATDGDQVYTQQLPATADFPHEVLLISGVCSERDVMRGEETQLIGCITEDMDASRPRNFIFPGTHSKHIWVQGDKVKDFRTFMTGELFDLLRRHSILKGAITGQEGAFHEASYLQGVTDAGRYPLLNAIFQVRTNQLFGRLSGTENFDYLSGLLIGTELKELLPADAGSTYLCGGAHLQERYTVALYALGHTAAVVFPANWIEEAVVRGQYKIWNRLKPSYAT